MSAERLDRSFFARPTPDVARELVGCGFFRRTADGLAGGTIVETEAYGGADDLASHASLYPRSRATIMAAEPGTSYVYRSYGIHHCFNVVAKPVGRVGAVLIRAIEPTVGVDLMRARRGPRSDLDLCRGPGRLCQALQITTDDSMVDVVASDDIWFESTVDARNVTVSPRVGITRSVETLWRFFDPSSPFVSTSLRVAV